MEPLWPAPSPAVATLIRRVAETLLTETEPLTEALSGSSLRGLHAPSITADPALAEEDRQVNLRDPEAR